MTLKATVWNLVRRSRAGSEMLALRSLARAGHLRSGGWFDSFQQAMPIDAQGNPIPWYTYSAIHFLSERVTPRMTVFEYGSGNSTLWWCGRAGRVAACEHDRAWFELMRARLPSSVDYHHLDATQGDAYPTCALSARSRSDIIVIDGRERVRCAKHSLEALTPNGVIVWDNSERPEYAEGLDFLAAAGFRRIDFWGMGPINTYEWSTSILYRDANCLGI